MKKFLGIILASLSSVILTVQVAQAHDFGKDHDHDADDHPTMSMPITSPITSPVLKFVISGNVTYRRLDGWFKKFFHATQASGVTITVKDTHKNTSVQTTTDSHGHYSVNVAKGDYKVSAHDTKGTFFIPPSQTVDVNHHNVTVNFMGFLWK